VFLSLIPKGEIVGNDILSISHKTLMSSQSNASDSANRVTSVTELEVVMTESVLTE
jgi:hypothetical protein